MAKTNSKFIATIEVDIDIALNFLESQFPNAEVRWGELRSLIAKQKAAEQSAHQTVCERCQDPITEQNVYCAKCGHWNPANRR